MSLAIRPDQAPAATTQRIERPSCCLRACARPALESDRLASLHPHATTPRKPLAQAVDDRLRVGDVRPLRSIDCVLHDGPECRLTLTRLLPADLLADDAEAALQLPLGAVPRRSLPPSRRRREHRGDGDRRRRSFRASERGRHAQGRASAASAAVMRSVSAAVPERKGAARAGEKRRHMREFR